MKPSIALATIGTCIVLGWVGVAIRMAGATDPFPWQPVGHEAFDPQRKDRDIEFHEGRVKRDPGGAIGWSMLSGAYLARARESDSYGDALRSEEAARKSLALRTLGNLGAQTRLVNALLQEHRFADALAADEKALPLWGPEPELNQLHADILIEIGRYEDARKVISSLPQAFDNPSGEAVIAHLQLTEGKPDIALETLRKAYREVDENAGASAESLAWFAEKCGECLQSAGKTAQACDAFRQTLTLYPRNYKALANLTRIAASKGEWGSVIDLGDQSNAIAPMADILALVGDAHAKLGRPDAAEGSYREVVALAGKPAGPSNGLHEFAGAAGGHGHTLDRQYAMFCADHNRDLESGYACALREMQVRRDVFAYDTFAWICLKRGDAPEALLAIDRALAKGTRDASMLYHAALINSANHRPAQAADFARRAIDLHGTLTPDQVAEVRFLTAS